MVSKVRTEKVKVLDDSVEESASAKETRIRVEKEKMERERERR